MIRRAIGCELLIAVFFSTLLISCSGESSSNNLDGANIQCSGSSRTIIDGRNVCPDNE